MDFIPYGRQLVETDDIAAVVEVLKSSHLTQGPQVPAFETELCERTQAAHAVAVNSATSALHIACLALGLKPGDHLWTSPTTFVASANCALYCGADVDFVDIDPSTGLMDAEALEKKLIEAEIKNRLPKIVVPVHLAGTSCDMERISKLCRRWQVKIIEDASHAIGGEYKGKPLGCCEYSDITVFSFHPVKIITTAEGGIATTNNTRLAERMQDLRSHGITKDRKRFKDNTAGPWSYEQQTLGFNYRLNDIQAALGRSQLKKLDNFVNRRHEIMRIYSKAMESLPVSILTIPPDVRSSLHLAVVRLDDQSPSAHKRVFCKLRDYGIGVQLHYSPVHMQPYYREKGFKVGDFPNAEAYGLNAISLPMNAAMTDDDALYVCARLKGLTTQ